MEPPKSIISEDEDRWIKALETVNMNLLGRVQMTPIKTEIGQYLLS